MIFEFVRDGAIQERHAVEDPAAIEVMEKRVTERENVGDRDGWYREGEWTAMQDQEQDRQDGEQTGDATGEQRVGIEVPADGTERELTTDDGTRVTTTAPESSGEQVSGDTGAGGTEALPQDNPAGTTTVRDQFGETTER